MPLLSIQVILNPDWNNITFANDIALVELNGAATMNDFVYPVCLPNGEEPSVNETCYTTGFGATGRLLWKLFCLFWQSTCCVLKFNYGSKL